MPIDAILFDANGTLIDIATDEWSDETLGALKYVLRYYGVRMGRRDLRTRLKDGVRNQRAMSDQAFPELDWTLIWRDVIGDGGGFQSAELAGENRSAMERRHQLALDLARMHRGIARRRLRAYPGALELLDQLRGRYTLAVVTDAQWAYARAELAETGVADRIHHATVSGELGFRKPDPRIFHHALRAIGVAPDRAVYVGNDLFRDIHGARGAGIRTVLVGKGDGDAPDWVKAEARPDRRIKAITDTPSAIAYLEKH